MKKILFWILSGIVSIGVYGQEELVFRKQIPAEPVPQLYSEIQNSAGLGALVDIDGDNDPDLIRVGITSDSQNPPLLVYRNDGLGNFTLDENANLPGISTGTVEVFDADADGDLDVFMIGKKGGISQEIEYLSFLYLNNGLGTYEVAPSTNFSFLKRPNSCTGDLNNDGYVDIVTIGRDVTSNEAVTTIYWGNSEATYNTYDTGLVDPYSNGALEIADLNADGLDDLVIQGRTLNGVRNSQIYFQQPNGNLALQDTDVLESIKEGIILLEDFNGDGAIDIMRVGDTSVHDWMLEYLVNNGEGEFTPVSHQFTEEMGDVYAGDANDDGAMDIVFTKPAAGSYNGQLLYINDGTGQFEVHEQDNFSKNRSEVYFSDIDGDSDTDLYFAFPYEITREAYFYLNEGNFYNKAYQTSFMGLFLDKAIAFVDLDNDEDLDIILKGNSATASDINQFLYLYRNDGAGNYELYDNSIIVGYMDYEAGDIDGDGDVDLFIAGDQWVSDSIEFVADFYLNDGNGYFSLSSTPHSFQGGFNCSFHMGDLDGDGDLDMLYYSNEISNTMDLYLNDGSGLFHLEEEAVVSPYGVKGTLLDYDNDGDLDFVRPSSSTNDFLYVNDGEAYFEQTDHPGGSPLPYYDNLSDQIYRWADVNGDNIPDLTVNGEIEFGDVELRIYLGDALGVFTEWEDHPFPTLQNGDLRYVDIENDGDMDLWMIGHEENMGQTRLFVNNGNSDFTEHDATSVHGYQGIIAVGDANNDGLQDLLLSGFTEFHRSATELFITDYCTPTNAEIEVEACNAYLSPSFKTWTSSGVYQDTISNSLGCDSIITVNLTIQEMEYTLSSEISMASVSPSSSYSYQWVDCNDNMSPVEFGNGPVFYAQEAGDYAVIVTDEICEIVSDCVTLEKHIGLNELDGFYQIHPNPTSNNFYIESKNKLSKDRLEFFSADGRDLTNEVFWRQVSDRKIGVDISHLSSGIYFIKSEAGQQRIVKL